MKKILLLLIVLAIAKSSFEQTLNISGTIKDEKNNPLPMVSVVIEKSKNGIATDSSGNFILSVPKYSRLNISALGFRDTAIIIENDTPLNLKLKYAEKNLDTVTVTDNQKNYQLNNQLKNQLIQTDLFHYKMENNISSTGIDTYEGSRIVDGRIESYHINTITPSSRIYQGSALPEFRTKEDTKGSLYLFDSWYKGIIAEKNSELIDDAKNLYNINKITGDLIMTRDFKSAMSIDKSQVNFFTLYDSLKNSYSFTIVPVINPNLYCQVIVLGDKYDIFKLTTAKFKKADFHSDGIASTGNNFDEYVNTLEYYLLNIQTNTVSKFDLKKKSTRQAFTGIAKADDFFSNNKNRSPDDSFLKDLGNYINNQQN